MAIYYFDSSAITKRYIVESGTNWVRDLHVSNSTEAIHTTAISRVEVASAITQRRRARGISGSAWERSMTRLSADFQHRYAVLAIEEEILDRAQLLVSTHPLRAYDAVQLATALFVKKELLGVSLSGLIFVSADNRLNEIAQIESLTVENPNNYPD